MAQYAYRTYVVFEIEDGCPACAEDRCNALSGGSARFGDQPEIAIRSVVEERSAMYEGGTILYCEEHQKMYDVFADGTPREEDDDQE